MLPEVGSLADRVHAMMFATKVANAQVREDERQIFVRLRGELRRAQRFVIDDEAVRLVCRLSHEGNLDHWAPLARLPYMPMWIEYDHHVKIDELDRMGVLGERPKPGEIPDLIGFLLLPDGDAAQPRWIAHQFCGEPGQTLPYLIAYVFDPEADEATAVAGSRLWRSSRLSARHGFPTTDMQVNPEGNTLAGSPEICVFGEIAIDANDGVVPTAWARHRAAIVAEPFWDAAVGGRNNAAFNKLLATQCREQAGGLRWLVTALAAINALPRDVRPIDPPTTRPRVVGAHVLPYLQRHSITITLPRDERIVRRARRLLDRAARNAPRPWHRVIGHWRVVERGRPLPPYICRHEPEMVEDGLAICQKCEMLVRWIPQHERGDPSIGMVEHPVYRVRGPRRRYPRIAKEKVTCTS